MNPTEHSKTQKIGSDRSESGAHTRGDGGGIRPYPLNPKSVSVGKAWGRNKKITSLAPPPPKKKKSSERDTGTTVQ